ncbi:MAG: restriction endonuclease subunit S [Veillonella parvula]|uniref:restriction endonuclease subunit S n=1 Tax=Veillonella parvula TaxID=29466 RepID=UPI002913DEFE|nr:restriction endonuclease subunit S [Veillonella parvula]MDU5585171.1 restriction endonuclease subunit S [Veillonella parvula]
MVKKLYKFPEVLFFQEGPGVRNHQYTTSGVKLLNVSNLRNGQIDLTTSDRYISENEAFNKYSHFLCDPNDFIIASSGIKIDSFNSKMGFIHQSDLPVCMNTSTIRFKVLNKEVLEIRYFMYYLKSVAFKKVLTKVVTGSAQLNFGPSHLKNMSISLPNLDVQKNIVQRLDRVNKLIEIKRKLLFLLDGLVKSRFVELFGNPVLNEKGWNLTSLESVCQSIYGGGTPSKKIKEYYMGTIPWVTSKDMKSDIIVDSIEHITQVAIDNSSTKIIPPESVLIVIRSGILKHTLPVCINKSRVTINQDLKALVLDERCKAIYLQYLLKALEKDILSGVRAVTADNIEFNSLKKRKIPIPPINIQIKFSQMVNQINKLKSDVQKSIDETQLLMDSLMQEYFG